MGSQLGLMAGLEETGIGRQEVVSEWCSRKAAGEAEGLLEGPAPLLESLKLPSTWPARGHTGL